MSAIPSTTSAKRLHFHTPDWKVTPTVDDIASACGLPPDLTGLIMTAIIGGLNRRDRSAFQNLVGSIPAGPNLLIVGADRNPRLRRLLAMLVHPLTAKQSFLRESVAFCLRDRLDLLQFGPPAGGDLDGSTKEILNRIKEGPFREDSMGLGTGWTEGRESVVARHPSVFLSNPAPDVVLAALDEALEGQLLVLDEHGDLFGMLATPPRAEHDKIGRIRALLGQQGADHVVRNLAPRSGPGSLEARQLSMISCVSREQLISLMSQKGNGLASLLRQFLLVDVDTCLSASCSLPSSKALSVALHDWGEAIVSAYHARIHGRGAGPIPPEDISDHLMHVMADFQGGLDEMENECRIPLGHLWSIPLQLYSALALVSRTGNSGRAHVLPRLDGLSERVVKGHLTALTRLRDEAAGDELMQRREAILRAIRRHGPCTFRVVIRSFSVQRKDLYEPLVCELIEEGKVVETNEGLLALPASRRNVLEPQERHLN
jgi:hypothetical protein